LEWQVSFLFETLNYNSILGYYTIKCGISPENFRQGKWAKTGIDVNGQAG
jgi:hypothetical protein